MMNEEMRNKEINYKNILDFYKGKRVFITGHTGFKGAWLTYILLSVGADVTGYSLNYPTYPSLFSLAELSKKPNLHHVIGDVRELGALRIAFDQAAPEIVFHLAAQPIVRESYANPVNTYNTNVMGTVHILECVRSSDSVHSFLNVTTDKVYKNNEWCYGYRESDALDGNDPYSNSKSCSELVTHSYKKSFFQECNVAISTARAGNVIGGGDFAQNRIIPDCVRALKSVNNGKAVIGVRNPYSIRPYEHVLEPLFAYMMIAAKQYEDNTYSGNYNVGPDDTDCLTTGELVSLFCDKWNGINAKSSISWQNKADKHAPHEANYLKLDCSKLKATFGWHPRWKIEKAIENTVALYKIMLEGGDLKSEMDQEIRSYMSD